MSINKKIKWTQKEDDLLKVNYNILCKEDLMSRFPNRTWKALRRRANQLGCPPRKFDQCFNDLENKIILNHYYNFSKKEIFKLLPKRKSWLSITTQARNLGLNSNNRIIGRFYDSVRHEKDCLIWNKKKFQFVVDGKYYCPGTFIYNYTNKENISGCFLRKSCGNSQCVNVFHIYKVDPKDEICKQIRSVASLLDKKSLSKTEYDLNASDNYYSAGYISVVFGSFQKACVNAGLDLNRRFQFSKDELLHYIRKFYYEFGFIPTNVDMDKTKGYPSDGPYYNRFGLSWPEIVSLAGLDTKKICGIDGVFYDSKSEANIANILYSNQIDYEPHKQVCEKRRWTCDFYIKDLDLWLEYDGLGEMRTSFGNIPYGEDHEKIKYYITNNYNYKICNIGDDVLDVLDLYVKNWNKNNFLVKEIKFNVAKEFLFRTHYLRGCPSNYKYIFGIYSIQDNLLCGVVVFGANANPKESGLCLSRFSTTDLVKNNFESFFMSKSIKYLKNNYNFRGKIVTWSDPRFHSGSLYKACNFYKTKIQLKNKNDYIYIDDFGKEYHKSKCRVVSGKSEREKAKSLGLKKINIPNKDKWEFIVK